MFQNHPASLSSPCPFTDTVRRHDRITEVIQDSNTVGCGGRVGLLHPSWCWSSSKVPRAQGKYLMHKLSSLSDDCIASVSTQLGWGTQALSNWNCTLQWGEDVLNTCERSTLCAWACLQKRGWSWRWEETESCLGCWKTWGLQGWHFRQGHYTHLICALG